MEPSLYLYRLLKCYGPYLMRSQTHAAVVLPFSQKKRQKVT